MSKKSVVVTPADRSRSRQRRYLILAFCIGGISILIPLLLFVWNVIAPPQFTIVDLSNHQTTFSSSPDETNAADTPSAPTIVLAPQVTQQLQSIFFSGQTSIVFCTNQTNVLNVHRLVHKVADVNAVQNEVLQSSFSSSEVTDEEEEDLLAQEQAQAKASSTAATAGGKKARTNNVLAKGPLLTGRANVVHVYTLDCQARLPSGKSVIRRFGLGKVPLLTSADPKKYVAPPPAFVVTNGEKPKWIPTHLFQNEQTAPELILSHVRDLSRPRVLQLHSTNLFTSACLKRKACVLVMAPSKLTSTATKQSEEKKKKKRAESSTNGLILRDKKTVFQLINQPHYRNISFVYVDTNLYEIAPLQKKMPPTADEIPQWPRLMFFRRVANASVAPPSTSSKKGAAASDDTSALFVKVYRDSFDIDRISAFIDQYLAVDLATPSSSTDAEGEKKVSMAHLKKAPRLLTRNSKQETESYAQTIQKRRAAEEQKRREEAAKEEAAKKKKKQKKQQQQQQQPASDTRSKQQDASTTSASASSSTIDVEEQARLERELEQQRIQERREKMEAEQEATYAQAATEEDIALKMRASQDDDDDEEEDAIVDLDADNDESI